MTRHAALTEAAGHVAEQEALDHSRDPRLALRAELAGRFAFSPLLHQEEVHLPNSSRITGNEPAEAADPGGTRSTKPGNPDKSGPSKPEKVTETQHIVSGDRNVGGPDHPVQDKLP